MALFTLDLLTGNKYLFSGIVSGGSIIVSGTTYPQVNLYSDLPSAITTPTTQVYLVRSGSGTYLANRKPSGLYFNTGSCWKILGDTPDFFKSSNFQIYDSIDSTKGVKFITSGITGSNFRNIFIQNSDGTIAYLNDVDLKLSISSFNNFTGTTLTANYYNKTQINSYSSSTNTTIDNKLNTNIFNSFTGTTLSANYYNKSEINNYTGTTGLNEITEINAISNTETTFNDGVILTKIRPTGDTTTAIQINKANGINNVINIDTISGFTGFGTIEPKGKIHTYGTDNSIGDNFWGLQSNRIIVDGVVDGDKDIVWMDNGNPKWDAQIYRNEEGKYWYLYNPISELNVLTVGETGRVGINARTNIMNYHVITISGNTIGMVNIDGLYDKNFIGVYEIKINNISGNPNTFVWRVSKDLENTYEDWSLPSGCTTGTTFFDSGIGVYFDIVTGFTIGDSWKFSAFPQLPSGTFVVVPNKIDEVLTTNDYTASIIEYIDVTGDINSSSLNHYIPIFKTGTTNAAYYIGGLSKINSIYFNLNTPAKDVILIVEYWNGANWIDISIGNSYYVDNTNNLTKNGSIVWNVSSLSWNKSYIKDKVKSGYELYWLRFRSSSLPTIAPILISTIRGGSLRLGVYSSPSDYIPKFYVNAEGKVNIGGGNISGTNLLQVNEGNNVSIATTCGINSLVEYDTECSGIDILKLKLASNDICGNELDFSRTAGTLDAPLSIINGTQIGGITFRGRVGTSGARTAKISVLYTGDGSSTRKGDILFSIACGGVDTNIIERVRMTSSGTTGFGVSSPTSIIHLQSGTTTIGALQYTCGVLLSSPKTGVIEFNGNNWYGTILGNSRKTFAFLESPNFIGTPNLPIGTTLNSICLNNYIYNSGGTNNNTLYKTCDFNKYSGSTQHAISEVITGATNGLCRYDCHNICLGGLLTAPVVICGNQNFCLQGKRIDIASSEGAQIFDKNGCGVEFYSSGGTVSIKGMSNNGAEQVKLQISNTQATFTDSRIIPLGIEYNADYSGTFTNRSLVDKQYVDTHSGGLSPKQAVFVASQININLSSAPLTIDSIRPPNNSRILVKAQNVATQNGIYVYSGSGVTMTRTTDYASGSTQFQAYVAVLSGNTDENSTWILNSASPITVGVNDTNFVLFNTQFGVTEGNGICVTQSSGNYNIATKLASNCGLCLDVSGLYINSAIAGTGLNYSAGVLSVCGSSLAGNSISWTGNSFNVNIASGTLSTALNSKLNTNSFNSYSANTLSNINNKLLTTIFSAYTGTTVPTTYLKITNFNNYSGTTIPNTYYNKAQINSYTGETATAINLKSNINSPTFTGIPAAPTASANTSTTQIATTAYVVGQASTTNPLMNGSVAIGTCLKYARADHVHPSDTSRLDLTTFNNYTGTTAPNIYQNKINSSNNQIIYNKAGTLTGTTGFIYTGTTLTIPNLRLTTIPSVSNISTDRTLFWNPTTCSIKAILLTGGSDNYHYKECTVSTSTASGTCVKYLGYSATTLAGRYRIDYNIAYGNSNSNGCSFAQFNLDGTVVGRCTGAQLQYANFSVVQSLSKDVTLTAGTHCLDIWYWAGSNTACVWYGNIRAKRIC